MDPTWVVVRNAFHTTDSEGAFMQMCPTEQAGSVLKDLFVCVCVWFQMKRQNHLRQRKVTQLWNCMPDREHGTEDGPPTIPERIFRFHHQPTTTSNTTA